MNKIKNLFKLLIQSIGVITIFALLGMIGSTNSIAIGNKELNNSTDLMFSNHDLNEITDVYGDFMNEIYPVITGESVDFKNLPKDSLKKYLNKITDLYPNKIPMNVSDSFDISPYISSKYGWRMHPIGKRKHFHTGVDIDMPIYTKIYATMTGKVVGVTYNNGNGYGNYVVIKNELGFQTLYAHLSTMYVKKGQVVNKGDLIGKLGNTGTVTGAHLHYEIFQGGDRKNPMDSLFMNHPMKLLAANKK